jgi:hypothetical protein
MFTAVIGTPGNKYAKDIIKKYSQSGSETPNAEKSKKDTVNQELKNMKNVKEFNTLFTNMYNGDEDKLFMKLYSNVADDPKLQKAFFDAIKANLKKYPDGIV